MSRVSKGDIIKVLYDPSYAQTVVAFRKDERGRFFSAGEKRNVSLHEVFLVLEVINIAFPDEMIVLSPRNETLWLECSRAENIYRLNI